MVIELSYELGFVLVVIFTLDISTAALWSVGRKEHVKKRFKRHKGQRWWAYRLWIVSCFLKTLLFYAAFIAFIDGR